MKVLSGWDVQCQPWMDCACLERTGLLSGMLFDTGLRLVRQVVAVVWSNFYHISLLIQQYCSQDRKKVTVVHALVDCGACHGCIRNIISKSHEIMVLLYSALV